MKEFPRSAVMEKKILIAEKHIDCCCNPPAKDGEHASSLNVFA